MGWSMLSPHCFLKSTFISVTWVTRITLNPVTNLPYSLVLRCPIHAHSSKRTTAKRKDSIWVFGQKTWPFFAPLHLCWALVLERMTWHSTKAVNFNSTLHMNPWKETLFQPSHDLTSLSLVSLIFLHKLKIHTSHALVFMTRIKKWEEGSKGYKEVQWMCWSTVVGCLYCYCSSPPEQVRSIIQPLCKNASQCEVLLLQGLLRILIPFSPT